MSILRVVCSPADVDFGGFTYETDAYFDLFDKTRTEGVFRVTSSDLMQFSHEPVAGDTTWYHCRYAASSVGSTFDIGGVFYVKDDNANTIFSFRTSNGMHFLRVFGDNVEEDTNIITLQKDIPYSLDIKVETGASNTATIYVNGALYGTVTAINQQGKGKPVRVFFSSDFEDRFFSEALVADEDTRGMRVRELRPRSFGIFQEWDGNINALRDSDLATGISTDTADRMVSFGVSNVEEVKSGDIINRVVMQTYAQKGETGLSQFQHFLRHKNGNVTLGAPKNLDILGDYYREEYLDNPDTGVSWQPEDFASLQTGIKSLL